MINLQPQESTQPSRKVQLLNVLTPQNEGIQRVVQGLDSSFRYQTQISRWNLISEDAYQRCTKVGWKITVKYLSK